MPCSGWTVSYFMTYDLSPQCPECYNHPWIHSIGPSKAWRVYRTHVARRTQHHWQSWNKYITTCSRVYYACYTHTIYSGPCRNVYINPSIVMWRSCFRLTTLRYRGILNDQMRASLLLSDRCAHRTPGVLEDEWKKPERKGKWQDGRVEERSPLSPYWETRQVAWTMHCCRVRSHLRQQNLRDMRMRTAVGSSLVARKLMQFHEIADHSFSAHAPIISAGEFPSGFPMIPIINSNNIIITQQVVRSRAFCHRRSRLGGQRFCKIAGTTPVNDVNADTSCH